MKAAVLGLVHTIDVLGRCIQAKDSGSTYHGALTSQLGLGTGKMD